MFYAKRNIPAILIIGSICLLTQCHEKKNATENTRPVAAVAAEPDSLQPDTASLRDSIADFALQWIGSPYVPAGCSPDGFDCSGFVWFVFKHFDISIPRSSADYAHFGTEIPLESIKKGDILVFLSPSRTNEIGHISIVIQPAGQSTTFVHSTSGKEMRVVISSLDNAGYKRRFVKAVSVLPEP